MTPTRRHARLLVPVSLVLAAGSAAAQSTLTDIHGTLAQENLGWAVVALGDLDGDGVSDFAVSAPSDDSVATGNGRVFVRSGATLQQLWVSTGIVSNGDHGYALANCGDVNGDGLADLLVGAPDQVSGGGHAPVGTSGMVELRSGADGALLLQVPGLAAGEMFGAAVAGLSDVNGDGVLDFAVSAPGADVNGVDSGSVRVLSGADGSILYSVPGPVAGVGFGVRIAATGDVDADGRSDLLVSAPSYDVGTKTNAGAVYLLSGATGAGLYTWFGVGTWDGFGTSVAGLGDVDGDGIADVGIGAPGADLVPEQNLEAGAIYAYSGASKQQVFARYGVSYKARLGGSVAAIEDVSGDGLPDILVGSPASDLLGFNSGKVRLFAGTDGAELGRAYGTTSLRLGQVVASLGDLDGDGAPEFAAGALDSYSQDKGLLRIYSTGLPMPPSSYCTGKTNSQGCVPAISAQGTPTLTGADDFVVTATEVLNNKPGLLIWGFESKLTYVYSNAYICVAPPFFRTGMILSGGNLGPDDCSGSLSFHFSHAFLAQHGLTAGTDIHVQAWYRDPALPLHQFGLSDTLVFFLAP